MKITNKTAQFFANVDMRKGYDGLQKLAKKNDLDLSTLARGSFAVFVNRKMNKFKLATCNDVVAYQRLPQGKYLDPRIIAILPEYFNGSTIDYPAAQRAMINKAFPTWFSKRANVDVSEAQHATRG